jgi:hypothetical protein
MWLFQGSGGGECLTKKRQKKPSEFITVPLKVPKGLWMFLEKVDILFGETPKEYIEKLLTRELGCILGDMSESIFDLKSIIRNYGEGSEISQSFRDRINES